MVVVLVVVEVVVVLEVVVVVVVVVEVAVVVVVVKVVVVVVIGSSATLAQPLIKSANIRRLVRSNTPDCPDLSGSRNTLYRKIRKRESLGNNSFINSPHFSVGFEFLTSLILFPIGKFYIILLTYAIRN